MSNDIALWGWGVTCHMGSQCYLPPDTS